MSTPISLPDALAKSRAVHDALARIAESLGVPISTLYDASKMPPDLSGASELLQLWLSLRSDPARARLLAAARAAVAAQPR